MNGFHIEGVTEDEGDVLLCAEISDPVPSEDAFNGHNDIFSVSFDGFKKDPWIRSNIALKNKVSFLVNDTQVHSLCMKIDSAVVLVLLSVEIHKDLLC
jgi:hypothetical protein